MKTESAISTSKELNINKMDLRTTSSSLANRKRRYQETSKVAGQEPARSSRNAASSPHKQTTPTPTPTPTPTTMTMTTGKGQFSSFLLFASLIILINLCPFQSDFYSDEAASTTTAVTQQSGSLSSSVWPTSGNNDQKLQLTSSSYLTYLQTSLQFVKLMFRQPIRLNKRVTSCTQAEARVLGKMAKVWYIKKKIKKLSKKLKKHTIAVPVFTAIPIYEHSYYPQPHVTHVSHVGGGGMHHAAASSYAPTAVSGAGSTSATLAAASSQQMVAAASSPHQHAAYARLAPGPHRGAMYQPQAGAHHIINAYAPSPPVFVDDTGGLYGHYGNAYGRYDGGYHVW